MVELLSALVRRIRAEGRKKHQYLEIKVKIGINSWSIMLVVIEQINRMVMVKINFAVIVVAIMAIVNHLSLIMQKDHWFINFVHYYLMLYFNRQS